MSHSVASHVVMHARLTTLVQMAALVRCLTQFALNVEKLARFLSSLAQTVLYTAAIVSEDKSA